MKEIEKLREEYAKSIKDGKFILEEGNTIGRLQIKIPSQWLKTELIKARQQIKDKDKVIELLQKFLKDEMKKEYKYRTDYNIGYKDCLEDVENIINQSKEAK